MPIGVVTLLKIQRGECRCFHTNDVTVKKYSKAKSRLAIIPSSQDGKEI